MSVYHTYPILLIDFTYHLSACQNVLEMRDVSFFLQEIGRRITNISVEIGNDILIYINIKRVFQMGIDYAHWRTSRQEVFCEKGVLRNFIKFIGKHLCQSLFFNKVAGLRPATLLKKRLWHRCFSVDFVKFLRPHFLTEYLWWLLLTLLLKP